VKRTAIRKWKRVGAASVWLDLYRLCDENYIHLEHVLRAGEHRPIEA
jgi:hypothetical protein